MIYLGNPVPEPYNEFTLSLAHPKARVLDGFLAFWAYHVTGFDDKRHCQQCFIGERELSITRRMPITTVAPLSLKMRGNYFYICGVTDFKVFTHKEYMANNFHMALEYSPGDTAFLQTYNGYSFIASDVKIAKFTGDFVKHKYYHMGYKFWSCRNYQFGAQKFVEEMGKTASPPEPKKKPVDATDFLPFDAGTPVTYPATGESETDW